MILTNLKQIQSATNLTLSGLLALRPSLKEELKYIETISVKDGKDEMYAVKLTKDCYSLQSKTSKSKYFMDSTNMKVVVDIENSSAYILTTDMSKRTLYVTIFEIIFYQDKILETLYDKISTKFNINFTYEEFMKCHNANFVKEFKSKKEFLTWYVSDFTNNEDIINLIYDIYENKTEQILETLYLVDDIYYYIPENLIHSCI